MTEVANALLMAERRKRITAEEISEFLYELQQLDIRVHLPELSDLPRVLLLAREDSLTAYDSAYLHLAMQLALPLATFDEALVRAARTRNVPLA